MSNGGDCLPCRIAKATALAYADALLVFGDVSLGLAGCLARAALRAQGVAQAIHRRGLGIESELL